MPLGQLCAALWDSQSWPDVVEPGFKPGTVVTTLALRCSALDRCVRVCLNYLTELECLKVYKKFKYLIGIVLFGKENIGYWYRPKMSYRYISSLSPLGTFWRTPNGLSCVF
jgi:hypothetical protein